MWLIALGPFGSSEVPSYSKYTEHWRSDVSLISLAEVFALILMWYSKKILIALWSFHDFFLYTVNNELSQISKIKKKKILKLVPWGEKKQNQNQNKQKVFM